MNSLISINNKYISINPSYYEDKDKSISDTLNRISNFIDNEKVIICLENLNNREDKTRLHLEDIIDLDTYITYDIGHS